MIRLSTRPSHSRALRSSNKLGLLQLRKLAARVTSAGPRPRGLLRWAAAKLLPEVVPGGRRASETWYITRARTLGYQDMPQSIRMSVQGREKEKDESETKASASRESAVRAYLGISSCIE